MGSESQLAIRGGPRTVRSRLAQDIARVKRGLVRTLDLRSVLPLTLRAQTSLRSNVGLVARFEEEFASMHGAAYGLAMNSGTAALHSAYFAVGVGPGHEVIVPSYTWQASATPVLACGAVPVFCDVDPQTFDLDPLDFERRITERTRAVCVVHIWGNPAPMDRIVEIADRHGIAVIEDCSHAHGARYKGRPVGSWGKVGCFSLQGSKPVDGGEAGIALTDDPVLYDRMLLLGHCGMIPDCQKAQTFPLGAEICLGLKYRPHLFAMCLARESLRRLPRHNARAARVWSWLCEELQGTPGLRPQATLPGSERGGYYAFAFHYDGERLGGPSTADFVAAVQAEGAPLLADQFRDTLLHRSPLFTSLDRRQLGGAYWDSTRPWEENLWHGALPVSEDLAAHNVRFGVMLAELPESYVRQCAQAMRKVALATLPSPDAARARTESEPRSAPRAVAAQR
jgi:dTDP-4-amino-4,6-dideoxygalactose transaminase